MDIASRDLAINKIKSEIRNRQTFLKNNFNSLKSSKNENFMLKQIYDDYNSYYDNQLTEKKALKYALHNLYEYLESIRESAEVTKYDAKKAKKEAKETLKKIKEIEEQIDEIKSILI